MQHGTQADYDTQPLEHFEPLVHDLFAKEPDFLS